MKLVLLFMLLFVTEYNLQDPTRLLGGRNTLHNEFPYVVRLEIQNVDEIIVKMIDIKNILNFHACTGASLTPSWTLTAAHCVTKLAKALKNNLQGIVVYGDEKNKHSSHIISYIVHPSYKEYLNDDSPLKNDVGLLETQPVILKQYGKLSAVNDLTLLGCTAKMVGYGMTSARIVIASTLSLKKPLQVSTVMIKKCEEDAYEHLTPVLCVATPCGWPVSLCPGDSGGPLIHVSAIVGLNSMADLSNCQVEEQFQSRLVGYVTPISSYIDWICNYVGNNSVHTSSI